MKSEQQIYRNEVIERLSEQGLNQAQIAEAVGLTQGRVSQLLKMIRLQGSVPPPNYKGASCKLTEEQMEQLASLLDQGAETAGYQGNIWTGKRVSRLIKEHFGVAYHFKHMPKLLRRMGYSLQKPQKVDSRKDPEAVAKWRREGLPAIKKST